MNSSTTPSSYWRQPPIPSNGVEEEVQIALGHGKSVIPIGISGHVVHEIWLCAVRSPQEFLPGIECATELAILGDDSSSIEPAVAAVSTLLERSERHAAAKT